MKILASLNEWFEAGWLPKNSPETGVIHVQSQVEQWLSEGATIELAVSDRSYAQRRRRIPSYRQNRKPYSDNAEQGLEAAIAWCREQGIKLWRAEVEGYEAIDVIVTLHTDDASAWVVSRDPAIWQWVNAVDLGGRLVTNDLCVERFGFPLRYLRDARTIMGDPRLNVPGRPGAGRETAIDLLARYGSLPAIHEAWRAGRLHSPLVGKRLLESYAGWDWRATDWVLKPHICGGVVPLVALCG